MRTNNQKGAGLVLVIMVMAVLSILGVTILNISLAETKQVAHQDKRVQAYYLAKSGADTVCGYILKNPDQADELIDAPESNANSQLSNGSFKVDVLPGAAAGEVKVKATGNAAGVENTSNVILKQLSLSDILDKAIYTNQDLDIQAMEVTGDIQSGGSIVYGDDYEGTAYPYSHRTIKFVNPFPDPGTSDIEVKNSELTISSDTNFNSLKIANNGVVKIVTGADTIEISLNVLEIKGLLTIDASGGGIVKLYVSDSASVTTNGLINNVEPKSLFIYLKAGGFFEIQANMVLNGYIIGPDATVQIQSDQSTVNGAIFSNIVQKNSEQPGHGIVNYVPLPSDAGGSADIIEFKVLRWER